MDALILCLAFTCLFRCFMETIVLSFAILTVLLLKNCLLDFLTPIERTMLFFINTRVPCLMESWRCDAFLIDFGLGKYDFGPFKTMICHFFKLVAILKKDVKLMYILRILFLNLVDSIGNVPKPHFHLLYLDLPDFVLREAFMVIIGMVGSIHLILLFKHPLN